MHISPTIHYNAGHSYKINTHCNTGDDEFVALNSSREDFFVNPFSSVLTIMQDITTCMYMYMYVHWYKCCWKKLTHSGTIGFAPEKHNEPQLFSLTLSLLKTTSHCNSIKVFRLGL